MSTALVNSRKFQRDKNDPRHGTRNGYQNLKCRCSDCRNANRVACADARRARAEKKTPKHVHGSANGYTNYSCRCADCRYAWALDQAKRTPRKVHYESKAGTSACGVTSTVVPTVSTRRRAKVTCGKCSAYV